MKAGNVALSTVIALAVGYFAGSYFGFPPTNSDTVSGNIGKAKSFKKEVSEEVKVFEERVANDSVFRAQTEASLQFVQLRAQGMLEAVQVSKEAIEDLEAFQPYSETLNSIEEFANNAISNSQEAIDKLSLIAEGNSDGGYEEAANKAIVSFVMSDNCNEFVRQYISAVDEYLHDKSLEEHKKLAFSRDQWFAYDLTTKIIHKEDNIIYDDDAFLLTSEEELRNVGASLISNVGFFNYATLYTRVSAMSNSLETSMLDSNIKSQLYSIEIDGLCSKISEEMLSNVSYLLNGASEQDFVNAIMLAANPISYEQGQQLFE